MTTTVKITLTVLTLFIALYLVFNDRPLAQGSVDKIGGNILLNAAVLKQLKQDTIVVAVEKYKICGNDPTTYLYSEIWNPFLEAQLTRLGFKTILFEEASYAHNKISYVAITCYVKNNDLLATEAGLHISYQKYPDPGAAIVIDDLTLKLKDGAWIQER